MLTTFTRDEAIKSLRSSPFFAKFDSAVLEHYYRYALMPSPSEESKDRVALATPPWCETAVFGETEGLGRAWDRLGEVRCPVGFIMAGDNTATLGDAVTAEMVWKPESSRNERIMNSGHLVSLMVYCWLSRFADCHSRLYRKDHENWQTPYGDTSQAYL